MEIFPQNVTALDGKEATISCRAFGAPNPNVTWIYNSEYLFLGLQTSMCLFVQLKKIIILLCSLESSNIEAFGRLQVLESGDLLISNVRKEDAGLYMCIRTNEAGSVEGEAYLTVMGNLLIIFNEPCKLLTICIL